MTEEVWVPVTDYESEYEVSSTGRLRRNGRLVVCPVGTHGYVKVQLHRDGMPRHTSLHRVVALAFLGAPWTDLQVNHIDGDKTNNRVENLEWVTPSENVRHAVATGLFGAMGERHYRAALTREVVEAIKAARLAGVPLKELAEDYGVSLSTISAAATGRTWKEAA